VYNKTDVAIKQLHSKGLVESEIEAFKKEADIMRRLPAHPNVVLFRGITLPPDPPSIVTDFCNGGSFVSLLRSNEPITMHMKVKFMTDIAKGMIHLHVGLKNEEIIHRDLAARNILLSDNRALVSDFGMARVKETETETNNTYSKVGPVKWMAPESLSKRVYSRKTDVFSFAVTMYEILTRTEPWKDETLTNAGLKTLTGERMTIPSETPQFLKELITRCWDAEPSNRPEFTEIYDILSHNIDTIKENVEIISTQKSTSIDDQGHVSSVYDKTPLEVLPPSSNYDRTPAQITPEK